MALPVIAGKGAIVAGKALVGKLAASKAVKVGAVAVGAGALAKHRRMKQDMLQSNMRQVNNINNTRDDRKKRGINFDVRIKKDIRLNNNRVDSQNRPYYKKFNNKKHHYKKLNNKKVGGK